MRLFSHNPQHALTKCPDFIQPLIEDEGIPSQNERYNLVRICANIDNGKHTPAQRWLPADQALFFITVCGNPS